ncbi:proteinase inhibitor I4 serpin [Kribbella flavida DSM 17836]|uniref:Proteinase inhibitor I4 serpin n=1 Tax=Kribbella flavida (strain DSM 17836 / JCM 10339 / NBRC 14399) TaxID=479435 RepID=D2PNG4_KRIFD|nr:serpin family protein [Kribbella flavida]ADB30816.1 proteinase inhibitor I4 serpin [Kribbella flavida DSM 17836]
MDANVVTAVNSLTSRWARTLAPGNTVISGLGLWPLLALLATAADEPGRAELSEAAGVDASTAASQAVDLIRTVDSATDLHAALGVWVHQQLKLSETFDSVIPTELTGTLTGDLTGDKATLDAWAAEHTDHLIREMPLQVTPDLAVVLASALSLRTTWARPFREQIKRIPTGPWSGSWHWLDRTDRDLDAVRVYDDPAAGPLTVITVQGDADVDVLLAIASPEAAQPDVLAGLLAAAARPAAGRPGSMLVQQGQPGQQLAPALTITQTTSPTPEVNLSLPSFAVQAEHDLLAQRELFGLTAVTSDPGAQGHFSAISPDPLVVGQANQTVLARFYATGFEAAAVTAMGMMRTSVSVTQSRRLDVALTQPFAFTALHRETRLPVVAGWIASPTEPE